jgi:hypothetical protein
MEMILLLPSRVPHLTAQSSEALRKRETKQLKANSDVNLRGLAR